MLKSTNIENIDLNNTSNDEIKSKIIPGSNVEIVGTSTDVKGKVIPTNPEFGFSVSQILKNGNLSILASEGLVLEIKPENVKIRK